ncbi:calcium-dependent phosphotriesterase [Pholiota conissans]|uniref:Calcium-dependent phosphotriesterase n=1 Tax=Pholiota conissans TaxID=109636 RepID=A0A9P5YXM7_9AGAR|nr:calcium-dependent phosphotriesterase [Pholiota conissans]
MRPASSAVFSSLTLCWVSVVAAAENSEAAIPQKLPPQSVFIDPRSFAVLNQNGPFRNDTFNQLFNPTSTAPPFFQIFDPAFLTILGPNPSFHIVASNDTFAFAHEAPIFVSELDEVFFASNDGGPLGNSDLNHNNKVGKISMKDVDAAFQSLKPGETGKAFQVPVTELVLPDTIQMTNGGTGPFKSSLVLINSGRGPLPPSIALVNPNPPHNATVLLDNFFGRQFNSLNDIKVHPTSGVFFFTDVTYGSLLAFRPPPVLPNQVYRFDPMTAEVRVVATDFNKCNGLAFSADGKTAYVTDTGANAGLQGNDFTAPATIYKFDVDPTTQTFLNRRIFAYVDTGIPDGVQLDTAGNVYTGCGDGVQVFSPSGTLLGKFFIGSVSANMVFAGDGRLVIMGETKIAVAMIAAKAVKLSFP